MQDPKEEWWEIIFIMYAVALRPELFIHLRSNLGLKNIGLIVS